MNNCANVPIAGRKGEIYLPPRMRPVWRVHPDQTGAIAMIFKVKAHIMIINIDNKQIIDEGSRQNRSKIRKVTYKFVKIPSSVSIIHISVRFFTTSSLLSFSPRPIYHRTQTPK